MIAPLVDELRHPELPIRERHPNVGYLHGCTPYLYYYEGSKWAQSLSRRRLLPSGSVVFKESHRTIEVDRFEIAGTSAAIERYVEQGHRPLCRIIHGGAAFDFGSAVIGGPTPTVDVLRATHRPVAAATPSEPRDDPHEWQLGYREDVAARVLGGGGAVTAAWKRWAMGPLAEMERESIVDSTQKFCDYAGISRSAIFIGIALLDRVMSIAAPILNAARFKEMVMCCVFIAAKLHDTDKSRCSLKNVVRSVPTTVESFRQLEIQVLQWLDFAVHVRPVDDAVLLVLADRGYPKEGTVGFIAHCLADASLRVCACQEPPPLELALDIVEAAAELESLAPLSERSVRLMHECGNIAAALAREHPSRYGYVESVLRS